MGDYAERLSDLRDRAHRIVEAARTDDHVSDSRVRELENGLRLIEFGWETVQNHPRPNEVAPFDLDAKLEQWERQFDHRERELGIQ